jgi:sugar phosphate permease
MQPDRNDLDRGVADPGALTTPSPAPHREGKERGYSASVGLDHQPFGVVGQTADLDSESEPERPTGVRYQVLAFACAIAVITYVHRLGFSTGAPEIGRSLGLNSAQIGLLMAAFLVAYGLFQMPLGLLGDRFGGRNVFTSLVLGWSLLTAAVALAALVPTVAGQFAFLLVARFLFGACQAGGFPVLGRIMADWMPITQRGFAQGSIWMFSRWGGALIPFLLTWLFVVWGNWPIPFILIAGLGVLWCAAFWPWFRNRPEEMAQVNKAERKLIAAGRPASSEQPSSFPWAKMVRSPSVWALCLSYGFNGFSGNFFTNMLPLYLREHRQLSQYDTAWLSALPLAAGSVACLLGGSASDWLIRRWGSRKWGRRSVGALGMAGAALCFCSTLLAHDVWLLGLLLTATFFFSDLAMGPAWASCADIGERYAGTMSGAMNMTNSLSGACGAVMAGTLFHHGQPQLVFLIFSGVYLLAAVAWLNVDVTKRLVGVDEKRISS